MKLVVVESPGKVKKIQSFLGDGYEVKASVGHVRDLPPKEMGVEPPDFRPSYVETERGADVLKRLRGAVSKADEVFLAMDLDREGEAIAWHLKDALRLDSYKRITFGEITKEAVTEAIANPRRINGKLVAAQEARRVLDRLVGYTVSPRLGDLAGRMGLSAGRVQSPAVRLVVDRERAIRNFNPTDHYGVRLSFGEWSADWNAKPYLPEGAEYLTDKATAEAVAASGTVTVASFEDREEEKNPPAPFTTSALQQAASNKLGMKPKATMDAAQKLYEQGAITYMRTDNPNLSDDALGPIREVCEAEGWHMAESPRRWKAKGDAQEAHEAIRPTHFDQREAGETADQQALYRLIWQQAVGCQLAPAVYAVREARLVATETVDGKRPEFVAKGRKLLKPGWRAVYEDATEGEDENASEENATNPVPKLTEGETLGAASAKVLTKRTKPPRRFTEAALVKELERRGIGRPSTYASIMENITAKGYVSTDKSGKYLVPTEVGELVVDALVKAGFSFVGLDYTKGMEAELDGIASGESRFREVVGGLYSQLEDEMKRLKVDAAPQYPCPECGKALRRRKGQKGFFWGCSGYPECKTTLPDAKGKPGERKAAEVSDVPCPKCGGKLVHRVKKGRKGYDFWGCSNFPKCDASYENKGGKPKT
ncbi:type I DNA topoisomerase (plasmid) [Guyparkeria sp. 1SP6A2]|nr:type I DNA topoisomerase [Guyparkeria sp. 1SP6A2]